MKIDKKIIEELVGYLKEFNLSEIEYAEGTKKVKVSRAINNSSIVSSGEIRKKTEIPIGVSCRTCDRLDCSQRAFPPLHKKFDVDINSRGISVYVSD